MMCKNNGCNNDYPKQNTCCPCDCDDELFKEVARIAHEVSMRREKENRCAKHFVNCMHSICCDLPSYCDDDNDNDCSCECNCKCK